MNTMEKLAFLLDGVLDQSLSNGDKVTITFSRGGEHGEKVIINVQDELSDIGYVFENDMQSALEEMVVQLQSFMDEQS
jgi:hypothetical protein